MTYLDWAATTPPDQETLMRALEESFEAFANPSSPHGAGRAARMSLERSRASFFASLSAAGKIESGGKIAFTASGTEADQIPLLSLLKAIRMERLGDRSEGDRHHLLISMSNPLTFHNRNTNTAWNLPDMTSTNTLVSLPMSSWIYF